MCNLPLFFLTRSPLLHETLLRLMDLIQTIPLRKEASNHSHTRQRSHNNPNNLQRIRIGLNKLNLRLAIRHRVDNADQRCSILAILICHGSDKRILQDLLADLVLENGATDGDADSLAEGAEEREEGNARGDVDGVDGGLDRESHGGEEKP